MAIRFPNLSLCLSYDFPVIRPIIFPYVLGPMLGIRPIFFAYVGANQRSCLKLLSNKGF